MNYTVITDPQTGVKVGVTTVIGRKILNKYIVNLIGGASRESLPKKYTISQSEQSAKPLDSADPNFLLEDPSYLYEDQTKYACMAHGAKRVFLKYSMLRNPQNLIESNMLDLQRRRGVAGGLSKGEKEYIVALIVRYNDFISDHFEQIYTIFNSAYDTTENTSGVDAVGQTYYDTMNSLSNRSLQKLLLYPPFNGKHAIDQSAALDWVNAQLTPVRKHLAKVLIDNTRYIPHDELIETLYSCLEKLESQLNEREYVLILPANVKTKSNYWISLILIHLINTRKPHLKPKDMGSRAYLFNKYGLNMIYVDADDMGYTGNQTENNLSVMVKKIMLKVMRRFMGVSLELCANADSELFNLLTNTELHAKINWKKGILSESISEPNIIRILDNFRYIVLRVFITNTAKRLISRPNGLFKSRITLIIGEEIRDLKDIVGIVPYNNIISLFNCDDPVPPVSVYFDHKIADSVSTLLLPLNTGIIPHKGFYDYYSDRGEQCRESLSDNLPTTTTLDAEHQANEEGTNSIQLINNCEPFDFKNSTMEDILDRLDESQNDRCPSAFYKKINYDTGKLDMDITDHRYTDSLFTGHEDILNLTKSEPIVPIVPVPKKPRQMSAMERAMQVPVRSRRKTVETILQKDL